MGCHACALGGITAGRCGAGHADHAHADRCRDAAQQAHRACRGQVVRHVLQRRDAVAAGLIELLRELVCRLLVGGRIGHGTVRIDHRVLAQHAGEASPGVTLVTAAHGILNVLVDAGKGKRCAVADLRVSGQGAQDHRMRGAEGIQCLAVDTRVVEDGGADGGFNQRARWSQSNAPRERGSERLPGGVEGRAFDFDCATRLNAQMVVGIIEARNHHATLEVHAPGARTCEREDGGIVSHLEYAATAYGQRPGEWVRRVGGKDSAVEQHQIGGRWTRRGAGSGEQERHEGGPGVPQSPPSKVRALSQSVLLPCYVSREGIARRAKIHPDPESIIPLRTGLCGCNDQGSGADCMRRIVPILTALTVILPTLTLADSAPFNAAAAFGARRARSMSPCPRMDRTLPGLPPAPVRAACSSR